MGNVAGSEQSLSFVDGVVQIRKLQESQIAHEIVDCIEEEFSKLRDRQHSRLAAGDSP